MPSTPTKPARSAAQPTAAPKPSPSRSPPLDLTSKNRLRAKQYQRAHEQQRIRAECPLIEIHESWDALRAAAPILPSSKPARGRPSIADTGDAHSRRASTVPAALADFGYDESDDESDAEDDGSEADDNDGSSSRIAPFRDTTFLTGTGHIAGNNSDEAGSEVDAMPDLDRYFAEYRMPRMPQWDAPLPTDMLASVRLLRQALRGSHVHYWALHDAHYAAQTEASKRRTRVGWKRAYLDATYGESTPGLDASTSGAGAGTGGKAAMEARKDGGEGDGSESDDAALLDENPGLRSPVGSEWSAASLAGDVPSSWRHRGGSKKKKKGKAGAGAADGMGDVRNLMKKVHYKLQLLEAEMARMGAEETKRKREREAMLGGGSRLYLGSKLNGFSPAVGTSGHLSHGSSVHSMRSGSNLRLSASGHGRAGMGSTQGIAHLVLPLGKGQATPP